MTPADVAAMVEHIRAIAGDDEAAHAREDELRHAVLQAIADGAPNAPELAAAALRSSDIEFARWCA